MSERSLFSSSRSSTKRCGIASLMSNVFHLARHVAKHYRLHQATHFDYQRGTTRVHMYRITGVDRLEASQRLDSPRSRDTATRIWEKTQRILSLVSRFTSHLKRFIQSNTLPNPPLFFSLWCVMTFEME